MQGMRGFFAALDDVVSVLSKDDVVNAARDSWDIVTDQIRNNAVANGFYDTGLLLDQRSIITNAGTVKSNDGGNYIYVESGVFKDDSAMLSKGKDPKKSMPAAMVAYWLEFGTKDHFVGLQSAGEAVKGIKPSFFISSAYDSKHDQAFKAFSVKLDSLIQGAFNSAN